MYVPLILLGIFAAIFWHFRRSKPLPKDQPTEYPGALAIIGHTYLILRSATALMKLLYTVEDFCIQNGGVICGNVLGRMSYGVTDPDDAYTVANACWQKHRIYELAFPYFGQNLITASGAIWKHHRKILSPLFSPQVINGFFGVMNSEVKDLVSKLEKQIGKGPYDHVALLRDGILKLACKTVFGDKNSKDDDFLRKYVETFDGLFHIFMLRYTKIWYLSDIIYKLSGWKKEETERIAYLTKITSEVVQWKKELREKIITGTDSDDVLGFRSFLDVMLDVTADGSLSEDEIRQELDLLVAATFETTSNQLVFTLTVMGSYPEVQERMYKEVMEVLGGDRDVNKEDIPKLVYMEAVIKEVLRLYPVGPILPREVTEDVKLKNCTLLAGSQVVIMTRGMHRTPVWGDDPEVFRPERWLDSSKLPQMNKSLAAFSLGKRSCVGKSYAMISMKIFLAHLVRQLTWTADHKKMQCILEITFRSHEGHEILVQRRKSNENYNYNGLTIKK